MSVRLIITAAIYKAYQKLERFLDKKISINFWLIKEHRGTYLVEIVSYLLKIERKCKRQYPFKIDYLENYYLF